MRKRRYHLARGGGRYRGRRNDRPRRPLRPEPDRTVMLNLNRITSFRYDLREIMSHYDVDEAIASSTMATVIAKGSRISTASAMAYVKGQEKAGMYPKEVSREVCDLLERFSKRR